MTLVPDNDTIIDEIHHTRRQIYDKFHGDITAILDDARKRQAASGRPLWRGSNSSEGAPSSGGAPIARRDNS
ncbi:MAG: hypothetical protein WD894_19110 [Pirellulales bacterium]